MLCPGGHPARLEALDRGGAHRGNELRVIAIGPVADHLAVRVGQNVEDGCEVRVDARGAELGRTRARAPRNELRIPDPPEYAGGGKAREILR